MVDPKTHNDIARLLPFYLNGTLDDAQRQRVEAALAESQELRNMLAEERQLMALVKAGGAEWGENVPPQISDTGPGASAESESDHRSSFLAFLSPKNWSPAVSLSLALVVCAQAGGIAMQSRAIAGLKQENYELASGRDPTPVAGSIVVEIKDNAQWSDVVDLFGNEGLVIASGGDFGALTLHSTLQGAKLQEQIARLKASPLIASAEPIA